MSSVLAKYGNKLDTDTMYWLSGDRIDMVRKIILANDVEALKLLITRQFVYNKEDLTKTIHLEDTEVGDALIPLAAVLEIESALCVAEVDYSDMWCGNLLSGDVSPLTIALVSRFLIPGARCERCGAKCSRICKSKIRNLFLLFECLGVDFPVWLDCFSAKPLQSLLNSIPEISHLTAFGVYSEVIERFTKNARLVECANRWASVHHRLSHYS